MASAGCVLTDGQPAIRTIPPLTTAAARNGTALDRSGSITQCRAAIGPGETCQRLGCVSSTSTPASRSIATVIATCGADGTDSPVCTMVRPSVNEAPDSSSPETNCDDADASISTVPPRHRSACRGPRTAGRRRRCPRRARAVRPAAARSGGRGPARRRRTPPSRWSARRPAGRTAAPCLPGRSRSGRRRAVAIRPLTVSSVSSPSTVTPRVAQRADHQVGVAAAQRAADRRRPLRRWPARRARAPGWSATSSRAPSPWHAPGSVVVGACQVVTAPILPCRCFLPPWAICVGDSR